MTAPEPVFEAPWHAQLFAITVHLNQTGRLDWPDWAQRFGATLARHGASRDLNGGDDYFNAWLETLEGFLAEEAGISRHDTDAMRLAWEKAYLATPHGQPVRLKNG